MSGHASLDQPRSLACFSLSASSLNAAEGTSFAFDKKIAAGLRVPGNRQLPSARHGCKAFPTFHAVGQ